MPLDDIRKMEKQKNRVNNGGVVKCPKKRFGKCLVISILAVGTLGALFGGSKALSNYQAREYNQNVSVTREYNQDKNVIRDKKVMNSDEEKLSVYYQEACEELDENIDLDVALKVELLDDYIAGRTFDSTKMKEMFGENVTEEDLRNWRAGNKSENITFEGSYEDTKGVVDAYLLGIDKTYEKHGVENKYAQEDDFSKKLKVYDTEATKEVEENIDVGGLSPHDHVGYYIDGRTIDFSRLKETFGENLTIDDLRCFSEGKDSVNMEFDERYEDSISLIKSFVMGYDNTIKEQELENESIQTKKSVMAHYHNQEKEASFDEYKDSSYSFENSQEDERVM